MNWRRYVGLVLILGAMVWSLVDNSPRPVLSQSGWRTFLLLAGWGIALEGRVVDIEKGMKP